ncbi:cyclophilin-like fold protein [Hymenobacter metallicola]|nr:cyclophilin-like fold protein [Hymenobacter metallicola]
MRITLGTTALTATLTDNPNERKFAALLPLTLPLRGH